MLETGDCGTMTRFRKRVYVPLGIIVVIAGVIVFWNWDWFIPLAESRASAALGRRVTIAHLNVELSRRPLISASGVTIGNPADFPDAPPFAAIETLRARLDIPAYLSDRTISIPEIAIIRPVVEARALDSGANNWTIATGGGSGGGPAPKLGQLDIAEGRVHAVVPKVKADFAIAIATQAGPDGQGQLVADAKGTYAAQPVTGHFVGGAVLSLRDAAHPYPVDLTVANGPTHVSLAGTIADPLAFKGADLKLRLAGPDLALLLPLTGIAIPQTPSYEVAGQLDYADGKIRFHGVTGRIGSSDIEGDIDMTPGSERPLVTATLASRKVDLADLGGFIGSTPGRVGTPGQSAAQRAEVARAEANPRLIPNRPINLPKLKAADIELHYRGARIAGQSIPLDNLAIDLTIKDGDISLHPVSFGIGRGKISGAISLAAPSGKADAGSLHARADIDFERIELSRLMASLHSFEGAGTIGGKAVIDGTGNSLAGILDNGNGELKLIMGHGGNISALLVDLSGLQFGNAVLSALGIPNRATLQCLITDFALRRGILTARTLLLDTSEANIVGKGDINLRDETLNMRLRTDAKHFTIGSLATDIIIDGKLKDPSIGPEAGELAARAGAAIGLGILLTPLGALLPTIQFGEGDDTYCAPLLRQAQRGPAGTAAPR
jgi:uncharacterized protein involved in outer membrane biogenesis